METGQAASGPIQDPSGSPLDHVSAVSAVPTPRLPIELPNSPEQRAALQDLADLLRTVAEYFTHKDVKVLAERTGRWAHRVQRLLDHAIQEDLRLNPAALGHEQLQADEDPDDDGK
jgi:hypothetical protein